MSYILDALKKSEQERGHGSAPSVQTLHASGWNHDSGKAHRWPYILLAAIVINLAALLYFIVADNRVEHPALAPVIDAQAQKTEPGLAASESAPPGPVSVAPEPADEILYKPVAMPVMTQAVARPAPPASETRPVASAAPKPAIVHREELPTSIQQHIPIMEFSAHVYSSNPLHRSIVINGRFMEEGDQLASDLTLDEITPKGAVFNYQGQLFHQNVVSAWN